MYYQSPLVTGTTYGKVLIPPSDSFSSCPLFNKTNNYSLHDDPLLDTNTQSRVTCNHPGMPGVLVFCTTQLRVSTSAREPCHVPSMESFSILPHFNSVLTRITSTKWCIHFSLQFQVITSPRLVFG